MLRREVLPMAMTKPVYVVGVGMTKFEKPLSRNWDYADMGKEAGCAALKDAGIPYSAAQAVVASYCYGEPTCGQRTAYELGLTGVPIFNVNNNCSSGSSALMLAARLVKSGYDCVIALGFEKMERGLSQRYTDRLSPVKRHMDHMLTIGADAGLIRNDMNEMTSDVVKLFAYAAREYMTKYPACTQEDFANIAFKNRRQGMSNARASIRTPPRRDALLMHTLCYPITVGMSAPTADGGAAAIVCSRHFLDEHSLWAKGVEIIAQHMVTDTQESFGTSFVDLSGFRMAKEAAAKCYAETGLTAKDVQVLEVHDCFACNELLMYEALGLAEEGGASRILNSGVWRRNQHGGDHFHLANKWVVNPSGGLETKGHPIGATGLAQCAELVWQLRGEAGERQVDGARVALQHNFGIGGAAVVTMYRQPKEALAAAEISAKTLPQSSAHVALPSKM